MVGARPGIQHRSWADGNDGRTRVLLSLIGQHAGGHVPTLDSVADQAGFSRNSTYKHLCHLKADGLVDWVPHTHGTLRPLVQVTAHTPPH